MVPNTPDADVTITSGDVFLYATQGYSIQTLNLSAGLFELYAPLSVSGPATVGGAIYLSGAADLSTGGLTVAAGSSLNGQGEVDGTVTVNGTINTSSEFDSVTHTERLLLTGPVSGTGQLVISSSFGSTTGGFTASILELSGPVSTNVTFGAGDGVLQLDNPATFTGTITPSAAAYSSDYTAAAPSAADDQILLMGASLTAVTGLSYSGTSTGGTLTIQEDALQQSLNFAGNYTAANFSLSAAPQGAQPGLDVTVTPTPANNTLYIPAYPATTNKIITNNGTLQLAGSATAGATVTLSAAGTAAAGNYAPNFSTAYSLATIALESYTATLNLASSPGLQTVNVIATATNAAGSTVTTIPIGLDLLPAPINGVTTADTSSGEIASLRNAGFLFGSGSSQFAAGTEAVKLTNGTYSLGPDTTQALIQRLYFGLLHRTPDAGGLSTFSTQIDSGVSAGTVADRLINSAEGTALGLPMQAPALFVQTLYSSVLGRMPGSSELAGWVNTLAGGGLSSGQVAAGIAASAEAKTHFQAVPVWATDIQGAVTTQLFRTALGRDPELSVVSSLKQQLTAGLTAQAFAQIIASSAEFGADHNGQSPSDFVSSLYQAGLGRSPAASELPGWVGQIQAGATPASIVYGIATSSEAVTHISPSL